MSLELQMSFEGLGISLEGYKNVFRRTLKNHLKGLGMSLKGRGISVGRCFNVTGRM